MEDNAREQLVRLIYVSVMTEACDTEALENILKISRDNNTKKGITGVLCYDPSFFLQCIEGPREIINQLYTNISRDSRHQYLTILEYADVTVRIFGDWSMGFLPSSVLDQGLLEKYAPNSTKFNPYILNGKQVRNFLLDVVKMNTKRMANHRVNAD